MLLSGLAIVGLACGVPLVHARSLQQGMAARRAPCVPGSTWEAVRHVGALHSITMWEYALHATGLNINMEGNTAPSTILIPLDDSMLACKSADECGQVDTYWRGQLTSATYFGLLLLHWTVGEFAPDMNSTTSNGDTHVANTLLAAVLGNTSADNGWKLAAQISNSSVASVSVIDVQGNAVTLPSGVVASYATCGGTTIHVIRQPIVPPDFPSVNATSVPGLQDFCWRNIWSAGFQLPGQVSVNNPNGLYFKYFSFMSFFTGKYPGLYVNLDLAQPSTNVTFFIPDAHVLAQLQGAFEEIPSGDYGRAHTLLAHYIIPGGYCMESLREPRWIPTLAASYLGQNLSLLIQPGRGPNEVEIRTSMHPDRVVPAKFLTTSCYSTIYALGGLLPLWDRWQDIPPSEPAHFPRVNEDLLFSVDPTCGASDAIVGWVPVGWWASLTSRGRQGDHTADSGSKGDTSQQVCISPPDSQRRVFSCTDFENGIMQPCDFTFDLDNVTNKRLMLGAGRFGEVFAGHLMNGEPVAIKCVQVPFAGAPLQLASEERLAEEARILKHCRSAYVVSFVGIAVDSGAGELYLLTQRMAGGNLFSIIRRQRITWNDGGWEIALNIAQGLVYLASKRIVHNDLKSSNVLLDGEGRAKISDVGLAKMLYGSKSYQGVIIAGGGSFHWCAPETILGLPCTPQADIFSLGVVMWELITGATPIRGAMRAVRTPEECPEEIADLLDHCWERHPEERPTAAQVVSIISSIHGGH
ncbi:hypothetical protein ACKKBG_A36650 [Auxenochlorella protothecoides x Auxenochlorella symbiontica]